MKTITPDPTEPTPMILVPCFGGVHEGCGGKGCECDCHRSNDVDV